MTDLSPMKSDSPAPGGHGEQEQSREKIDSEERPPNN